MHVLVVHNAVTAAAAPDAVDVLAQVRVVRDTLGELGHTCTVLPCTLNLQALHDHLTRHRPDVVFNLVESLAGRDSLIHLAPAVVASLGVPCTGAPATALVLSSNKLLAKERLAAAGFPTPDWLVPPAEPPAAGDTWIVKSVCEHASVGLDEHAIVTDAPPARLADRCAELARATGGPCFAEAFIPGREFNLALLADGHRPQVLPPAEIRFEDYAEDRPHIVCYKAKWQEDSFEYTHTPRSFDFPPEDAHLLTRLVALADACWRLFGLRGYARVDFRVDATGQPWILEVNANPCLAPDAGFAAAAARAGLSPATVISRILADATR